MRLAYYRFSSLFMLSVVFTTLVFPSIVFSNETPKISKLRQYAEKFSFDGAELSSEKNQYYRYEKHINEEDVDAIYTLATKFIEGNDLPKDPLRAAKWFRKAAEMNHLGAMYKLGVMYRDGIGVAKSLGEAIKWLRVSAEFGNTDAKRVLDNLIEVKNSSRQIKRLTKKNTIMSAFKNSAKSSERKKNNKFLMAAENGDSSAQYKIGLMLLHGKGIRQDTNQAIRWLRKASLNDYSVAQLLLGKLYYKGEKVENDFKKSAKWLNKAARNGHAEAQYYLAGLYWQGQGVSKSITKATMWDRKAAKQGHRMAMQRLNNCMIC